MAAFNGADTWLTTAGANIIAGLISGMENKLGDLKTEAGKIGHFLVQWKVRPRPTPCCCRTTAS